MSEPNETKREMIRGLDALRLEVPDTVAADVRKRVLAHVDKLEEALIWCSGSPSFAKEGEAREGWEKVCAPLIAPEVLSLK